MSLGKCRECGAEVSTEAKACPKCGATKPTRQRSPIVKYALPTIAGLILVGAVIERTTNPGGASRESVADQAERTRVNQAGAAARTLRAALRNPDSFDLERVIDMGDGNHCVTYRAQNGFGGMNVGKAIFTEAAVLLDRQPEFQAEWAKRCAGQGRDITSRVARRSD